MIDIMEKRFKKMKEIPDYSVNYVPLEQRIDRYTSERESGFWLDPLELSDEPNLLMTPFYFYGGYVALNS